MAGTWRDAKCKLPRRSSPSSKDRATGEPDDAKVSSPVRRGADGKGRSRLPVTADAYGLTNPGIRRNLASRLPYENHLKNVKPFVETLRVTNPVRQSRASSREASLAWGRATVTAKHPDRELLGVGGDYLHHVERALQR